MKRSAWRSVLMMGCLVGVIAAGGCGTIPAPGPARLQKPGVEVLVEEGLAEYCSAADNPDFSLSEQNYYLRWKSQAIRNKALVVNARMADRKEPPITLGLPGQKDSPSMAGYKGALEALGYATVRYSPDTLTWGGERPDYLIGFQTRQAVARPVNLWAVDTIPTVTEAWAINVHTGQGRHIYSKSVVINFSEAGWQTERAPSIYWYLSNAHNFLTAQMIKGELSLKSEKYDALMDSLRYSEVGQDEQALALLNKAVELDGKFLLARRMRLGFFRAKGRWDDAIKETSEILTLSLSDPKARLGCYRERGILYYWTEAFDAALKDFEQVLALDPKDADAFVGKGWVLLEKNELGKAADAFEFALALDPNNMQAFNGRGWVLAKKQKYAEALKEFDRGQAAQNRATRGHVYCYKMLGEKEKARAALADVLEGAATWPKCPLFERYKAELQQWAKELE